MKLFRPLRLWLATFLIGLMQSAIALSSEPFAIVVLPDTQNYVRQDWGDISKFSSQTEWIKQNAEKLNIRAVIHVGDITNKNSPAEWQRAKTCMDTLTGFIPWVPCVGNHDIGHEGPEHSLISEFFPESELSQSPGWGGKMPGHDCYWYVFKGGGVDYLILSLNLGPSDEMLAWADGVIAAHPDHKVIMVTHEYVAADGSLSTSQTKKNATAYGKHTDGSTRNTGAEVWDKHVRKHKNYLMVVNGHYNGIAARNEMKGDAGNTVHQMMSNYQYSAGGGNGFMRILKFLPAEKKCEVTTFSPHKGEGMTDEANQFSLDLSK